MHAILIGMALSFGSLAPSDIEMAERAAAEFEAGVRDKSRILLARKHFNAAADAYLALHERGHRNAKLYRSLGNALTLADRWPEAIWAYQEGLMLAPGDITMRRHLIELRAKVLLPPDGQGRIPSDGWPVWLPRLSVQSCWWLAFGSYLLLCLAASGWRISRTRRWIAVGIASLSAVILFTIALLVAFQGERLDRERPIAVVLENTPFRKGNGHAYPQHVSLPTLPRGLETRVIHQRSGWSQVILSTGEIGWIPTTATRLCRW